MLDDDDSVTKKLLTPTKPSAVKTATTMNSAVIQNEKSGEVQGSGKEPDLRLHDAVCDPDNIEEIETLIEEEPELLYERDDDGHTPLHTVCIDADDEAPAILKLLLGVKGGTIERPDLLDLTDIKDGWTGLHHAAYNRHVSLVEALIRWGANIYIQDKRGNTALHLASQGMMETAIECGKLLLDADVNKTLINAVNNEEKTALHKAIDERSVVMSKFLLKPEKGFDLSQKDKQGWNILHYICSGTEESDSLCEILKAVVHRSKASQLNQEDNKLRTPLILASIQRLPKIVSILVSEDNTNVLKVDDAGKLALHYACQNGCYPKGHKCVEILIERKFPEKEEVVKHLYNVYDNNGNNPFMYACLNCPTKTIEKYMDVVKNPRTWLTSTLSTLLYKHCPLALTSLMNKAFTEDKNGSLRKLKAPLKNREMSAPVDDEGDIKVDYGPVTGYLDTVGNRQESCYLKNALYWEYEPKKEILLHPLVQLFMLKKWYKLRWIILAWVIWQLIWLTAFTTLIISHYAHPDGPHSKPLTYLVTGVMLIYIVTSMVNEGFELYTVKMAYFSSLTNISQVAQNLLAFISILPIDPDSKAPPSWQKYATAVGILLAYILSMRDIGKLHEKIGLIVEVLKQVLIQIVHVLFCCAPLWIGFTLAFIVIFDDDKTLNSAFPGPIVKVLVMMTGEFEYNDTFPDEDGASTGKRFVRLLFFLSFLISVPVAFFNLLTGFALDKVIELRERAKVGRIAKQLEHIYFIESILLSLRPLGKIIPCFPYELWMRRLNVTTAWLDQKWIFYTEINEQIRQQEQRNLGHRKGDGCLDGLIPSFCSVKVPTEVEKQIFALATANSHTHQP